MSLGIAAGAFAQNYAAAKGLKSRLDSEKQQQELTNIKLETEREFRDLQKQQGALYQQFLDPNFDFVGNKPYEVQQGGIASPGQARPQDPYMDSARVNAYYDRMAPMMERQAQLSGKDPWAVRREIKNIRKEQFVERVGNALSMIYAGNEEGIKGLQSAYQLFPDGRTITGGKINQDGSVLLQYEQGGIAGEKVVSRDQLMELGKLALNPADAVKLRVQLVENEKNRQFTDEQRRKGEAFTTSERVAGQGFRVSERQAEQTWKTGEREASQTYELPFKQGALNVSQQNADSSRVSANASARNAKTNEEIKRDAADTNKVVRQAAADAKVEREAQRFFDNAFGTSDFKVKTDEEVKALLPKQKKAYEEARGKHEARAARRNAASGLWDLNGRMLAPSFISNAMPAIEQRVVAGKFDGTDAETGLPYVNINGKKVLLPKD